MPAPPLFCVDDPSVCIVHSIGSFWFSLCLSMVNFVMKSASAWTFMVALGLYLMLNWLSSMAHYTIRPTTSGLFITFLMGLFDIKMMGFAWKYGRSFQEATTKANVIFSMRGYLALAPWKAWLIKYIRRCTLCSSLINAALTAVVDTVKYGNRSSPFFDRLKSGGLHKYRFSS